MHLYCKKCKRHRSNTFPKKIVLISNNKIKGKSRCFICLTERSFIDKVQYDLEKALEIYLQFYKHEKYTISSKAYKNWKTTWYYLLLWV